MKTKHFVLCLVITTIVSIVSNCIFLYYGLTGTHNAIKILLYGKIANVIIWLPVIAYVFLGYGYIIFTSTVYDRKRRRVVPYKDVIINKIKEVVGIK